MQSLENQLQKSINVTVAAVHKIFHKRWKLNILFSFDSCLVSGSWWRWTHVSFSIGLIILEKKFSGFALSMSKFPSLNRWRHAFCSGVNIRDIHRELTFDIIKTEWMILETVPVMGYNTDLNATILKNHVHYFLAHLLWRCCHWSDWTWIVYNRFHTPLKLLGPKLYLVVGRRITPVYSIHPFMNFFRLLPFLCEEFYHETMLQIPRVHCKPARHCTCHPSTASTYVRLFCDRGCYMSRHVPTCRCKVTPGVAI